MFRQTSKFNVRTNKASNTILELYIDKETAIDMLDDKDLWSIDMNVYMVLILDIVQKNGKSHITQKEIADITGMTQATVSKKINDIVDKGLICRELLTGVKGQAYSEYTVGKTSEPSTKAHTSKDVIIHFMKLYEEKYGCKYVVSWGKDATLVKTKLMDNYDFDTIIRGIDFLFEKYDTKYATVKYPRPNIFTLCSWVWNNIMTDMKQAQIVTQKQTEALDVDYDEQNDKAMKYLEG